MIYTYIHIYIYIYICIYIYIYIYIYTYEASGTRMESSPEPCDPTYFVEFLLGFRVPGSRMYKGCSLGFRLNH